jgi:hypothetical protein
MRFRWSYGSSASTGGPVTMGAAVAVLAVVRGMAGVGQSRGSPCPMNAPPDQTHRVVGVGRGVVGVLVLVGVLVGVLVVGAGAGVVLVGEGAGVVTVGVLVGVGVGVGVG